MHYAVSSMFYAGRKPVAILIGGDGRVGSAIEIGFKKEGWEVRHIKPDDPVPQLPGAVLVDAGAPGVTGYHPPTWSNYYGAVERATRLIGETERAGYTALVLFSTPWVAVRSGDPYSDTKMLIEQLAQFHNRHGDCFVLVDRVGMQNDEAIDVTRFEESVKQGWGELAERIISSLEYAVPSLKQLSAGIKPLPPVLQPKPFVDDAR